MNIPWINVPTLSKHSTTYTVFTLIDTSRSDKCSFDYEIQHRQTDTWGGNVLAEREHTPLNNAALIDDRFSQWIVPRLNRLELCTAVIQFWVRGKHQNGVPDKCLLFIMLDDIVSDIYSPIIC